MSKVGDLFLDLNLNTKPFDMQMQNVGNYAQKSMSKSFGGIAKIIGGAFATGAVIAFGKSCLDLGSDLAEVQNVVDVTFPHMNAQVDSFAKNAINQFGLSETVAKRMTGTYGAMSKAFGFSEKAAYDMATSLTGLAGDVASFYNIDPTEAYTKLKSVFSGETETLKDLGIVMTQNALDQYALANGFGKTTAEMTEQEKVMLRLQFVTQQLNAASGDFARTSDSWANKVRVLNLNFQSLKATIGQGLINVLSPLVSLLNNIIVKLQKAAQYFVAFTSLLSGKKTNATLGSVSSGVNKISNGLGNATSGASDLSKGVNGVGKAAKKAAKEMGSLASFDEIKNLKSNNVNSGDGSSASGGSSGVGGGFDLAGGTQEAMNIDTSGMEKSINKMKSMWNGFTSFLKKNKAVILSLIAGIVAGFLTFETLKNWGAITAGISSLLEPIRRMVDLFKMLSMYPNLVTTQLFGLTTAGTALVVGIAAVTAALVYLYQTSDSFRNLVNLAVSNLFTILNNLWSNVLQPLFAFLSDVFVTIIIPIATFIATVFVKAVESLATIALSFWNNVLSPIANFLVNVLSIALQGVIDVWIAWKPIIQQLFTALNWIWNNALSPLVDFIVGIFCDGFKQWGNLINRLIPDVQMMFQGFIDFFVGVFTFDMNKAWSGIQKIFEGFLNFLKNIFATDWTQIIGIKLGTQLNALLSTVKSIWNAIKGVFNGIITFITGVFTGNWKKAWQGVKDIFSSIVKGIANIFKSPINAIINGINTFIGGLNKIKIPDWVPGVGGFGFNISKIPKLAQGGYVKANTPQLAMIGDNKTQGEIVSPEGKMFEVMMSALKAYGAQNNGNVDIQVIVSILYEILEAIQNLNLVVDGDSLYEDNKKRDKQRALRTGKMIID